MFNLFNGRRAQTSSNNSTPQAEAGGCAWSGIHPAVRNAKYWLRADSRFCLDKKDVGTHDLFVGLIIEAGFKTSQKLPEKRLLFRRRSDYRIPGLDPDEVAFIVVSGLVRALLRIKSPRFVLGLYEFQEDANDSLWEDWHSGIYRGLLVRQLKIHSIPVNAYLDDPSLYLDLGAFNAPKDTHS